jgi:hypothetical protein
MHNTNINISLLHSHFKYTLKLKCLYYFKYKTHFTQFFPLKN